MPGSPTPRALTKLRAICLALPEAKETTSHGAPTFWSPKRTFAMFADASNHHGRGRHAVWLLAAPGRQERMVRTAPGRFFVPPYVGVSGWLGVWLDDVCDWEELADILTSAHQLAVERSRPKRRAATALLMACLAGGGLALAQQGRLGDFDAAFGRVPAAANAPYDGRFAFVRLTYDTLPGGYWYRGQPAWSHGFPTSEQNLMQILQSVTSVTGHARTNLLSLEDPEIFRYPLLYIIEVSWWQMTDKEASNLRVFLDKGGFVIVDDFKTAQWRGGRGWEQFADNMRRVMPKAQFIDLDISHALFTQFFTIQSLDIFPQAYNAGQPIFRGVFEGNDPTKRMQMFINYNTDISQFWEWSGRGLRPIDQTNEAYKLGVNAIIYGLTH